MRRRLVLAALSILLAIFAALAWIAGTEAGLKWVYRQALPYIPGELQLSGLSGSLIGPVKLFDVHYRFGDQSIELEQLDIDWRVGALTEGRLHISLIQIERLIVKLPASETPLNKTPTNFTLPEFNLPLRIDLQRIAVSDIAMVRGDETLLFNQLDASISLNQQQLKLRQLNLDTEIYQINLSGWLTPTPALAHELNLDWRADLNADKHLQGSGRLLGDLSQTRLMQKMTGALEIDLDLLLKNPLAQLNWQARVDMTRFDSRSIMPDIPVTAGELQLSAEGDLINASANGHLTLSQSPYGALQTGFNLQRIALTENTDGVHFEGLQLAMLGGEIESSGRFSWLPRASWQTRVSTRSIDPGIIDPEWPGSIDADLSLAGGLTEQGPQVKLDLKRLTGTLRNYPVSMQGKLDWKNNIANIQGLKFKSGDTRIDANGKIAQQFDLKWSIDSKDLAELYPEANGELNASGTIGGNRDSPSIIAQIRGSGLSLSDFNVQRVDADLDLAMSIEQSDQLPLQKLKIALDGQGLRWKDSSIDRVQLKADQQGLKATIDSSHGTADLEFSGTLQPDGWRGSLTHAQLRNPDFGNWRLESPATVNIDRERYSLKSFCLNNGNDAGICADIDHIGSDGRIDLQGKSIPVSLLRPWMPRELVIESQANATARLQYALPQSLRGEVDIELLPGHVDYFASPEQKHHIAFKHVGMRSLLDDSGIDTRIDIELTGDDTIRGSVALPNAKLLDLDLDKQELNANLRLQHQQLELLNISALPIENLRGKLDAELAIKGRIRQPRFSGRIALEDGALYLPRTNLTISNINLNANSGQGKIITYSAKARIADGNASLEGRTILNADAGWPGKVKLKVEQMALDELLKPYLPENLLIDGVTSAKAELSLEPNRRINARLGLVSVRGSLSYPLADNESGHWTFEDVRLDLRVDENGITALGNMNIGENRLDLNLSLPNANPLDLDLPTQPIDGKIEVLARDLSLIETFMPVLAQPSGQIIANLGLSGTLKQPLVLGQADLNLTGLSIPRLGLSLRDINLRATSHRSGNFDFNGSAMSADGVVNVSGEGQLNATQGWPVTMRISGENFEAIRIPEANVTLSPDLRIDIANRQVDVQGEVSIPFARLRPADVSSAARVSADTVIVGEEQQTQSNWKISSKVRLLLGNRVNLFAYGFDGRLGGNLVIEETAGQPTRGIGEITIVEGRYRAYGQHLDIEEGRLLFTGGPLNNPGLDVRAVRKTPDVVAGIKVTGRLQQPQLDLFSIPAVGQTDTLSYLLTGGPLDSASSGQGAMMANAALALKLSGGDQIARSIGDRFGFDEMRIESDSTGDQASLVVGRYLSPRLYVGYGLGLVESINTFSLRYQISDRWQLEAESGADQGADLFYRFER